MLESILFVFRVARLLRTQGGPDFSCFILPILQFTYQPIVQRRIAWAVGRRH